MTESRIPLFALNTVLFPGGPLPLRIFESRYLDMVSDCLRENRGFGICLIESGSEIGPAPEVYEVGTLTKIVDWHQRHDGLLGITVVGEQRFRVLGREVGRNQLLTARAEMLPNEPDTELPAEYIPMADFLRQMIKQVPHLFSQVTIRYGDAGWVSSRLAELLPLKLDQKQHLLQLNEPIQRLERLRQMMDSMDVHF
jgi:Lon protease-like protein